MVVVASYSPDCAQATPGQRRSPQAGNQCVAGACLNLICAGGCCCKLSPCTNSCSRLCSGHSRPREVTGGGRPDVEEACFDSGVCRLPVPVVVVASYHLALIPVHDFAQATPGQGRSPQAGDQCVVGSMLESALCRVPVILMYRWFLLQALTLHYILFTTVLRPLQGKRAHRRHDGVRYTARA
jgi:hypothetical protein